MRQEGNTLIASLLVVSTGTLWGVYWFPVRRLAEIALPGAWGTLAVVLVASLILAPFGLRHWRRLIAGNPIALLSIASGGAAFALYSVGLLYGRVSIVILLFYLTPVWSTLIGRYCLGWPTPFVRTAAIGVGLIGLVLVLSGNGGMPMPGTLGDWLGLASGILWSISSTGIRTRATTDAGQTAFVFSLGALVGAAALAPALAPWPSLPPEEAWVQSLLWISAMGGLWWGLSMVGLLWATSRLEPARVGILLMSEVLIGVFSAALFAGEHLGTIEFLGGTLVILAAIMEILPARRSQPSNHSLCNARSDYQTETNCRR
ncbi:DMT family transporter [Ectothiorhodospiraceae bacterium WFHF3C12]|nr:DMT family transporter [Ectothiorhodospiraceae bacterium WFHF3C12]